MARLFLLLCLLILAFGAVAAVLGAGARLAEATRGPQGDRDMTTTRFGKIAYALLIVLMFSAVAGAL